MFGLFKSLRALLIHRFFSFVCLNNICGPLALYECLLILYEIDLLRVTSQLWSTFRLFLRTLKDLHASPIKSI